MAALTGLLVGHLRVRTRGGLLGRDLAAAHRAREWLADAARDTRVPDRAVLVVRALSCAVGSGPEGLRGALDDARRGAARPYLDAGVSGDVVLFADEVELAVCLLRDLAAGAPPRWYWECLLPARGAAPVDRHALACVKQARWLPAAVAVLGPATAEQAAAAVGPRWCAAMLSALVEAYPAPHLPGLPAGPPLPTGGFARRFVDVALAVHRRPAAGVPPAGPAAAGVAGVHVSRPVGARRAGAAATASRPGPPPVRPDTPALDPADPGPITGPSRPVPPRPPAAGSSGGPAAPGPETPDTHRLRARPGRPELPAPGIPGPDGGTAPGRRRRPVRTR